jgi:prepilin-type N-terminal cleavage/methylation domain-containing protein
MRNRGFTFIEIMVAITIMAVIAAVGIPRIRDSLQKQNVRSARAATQTLVVKARAAAVARGCRSTIHLASGGAMWVTSCRNVVGASPTALDTLGGIDQMGTRFNAAVTTSRDSVAFDSRGLSTEFTRLVVQFTASGITDSTVINEVGKVVHE